MDVAIIGAGAAGLAAAHALEQSALSFVLLEADSRIGGRAHSEDMPDGSVFDLGCHWLHSATINPFVETADRLGVAYVRPPGDGYGPSDYYQGGVLLGSEEIARGVDYMASRERALRAAWSEGRDQSVLETVDRAHPWADFADYYDSLNTSSDVDQISIGDMVSYNDTWQNWPVTGGYGHLVQRWGCSLPVSLNTNVQAISWGGPNVRVETSRGTIIASRVILSVSTGVLASGMIRFTPDLPVEKRESVQALPLGNFNRIRLAVDWQGARSELPQRVVVARDGVPPMLLSLRPYDHDCVVGLVAGRYADWLEKAGPASLREAATTALCDVFGSSMRERIGADRQSAWRGNPFILGAYSTSQPGQFHQRAKLAQPLAERLFFCGEATSPDAFCTCHGARLTGERAAGEALQSLGC